MKAVMRHTGLSADTIRAWERRYKAVSPIRNAAGRRQYSILEMQRLKLLAHLVQSGRAISSIANLSHDQLIIQAAPWAEKLGAPNRLECEITKIIDCVRSNEQAKLHQELRNIIFELSPKEFVLFFVPQLISVVSDLFSQGKLSACEEHAVSEILGRQLLRIYEDLSEVTTLIGQRKTVVLTLPPGEVHDFGLLIGGILCLCKGLHTVYCAKTISRNELDKIIHDAKPLALLISVTHIQSEEARTSIGKYLQEILKTIPSTCKLWLGGPRAFDIDLTRKRANLRIFESLHEFENKLKNLEI